MIVADAETEALPLCFADLLGAVGTEMSRLGRLAERAQLVAGRLLIFEHYECEQTLSNARGLNVLVQTLDGLSALLGSLAAEIPSSWNVEASPAAQSLLLSALITKLTAGLSAKGYVTGPLEPGTVNAVPSTLRGCG